jgi:N-acetylglucosaminyldiphosphoundecaprenol N-acetyl-beta-D-mannosaminyltransferase
MKSPAAIAPMAVCQRCESEPHNARNSSAASPSINVLGVRVDALSMNGALSKIARMLRAREKGYLSAICVYGVMEAQRDAELAGAYADAAIAIPDGMPVAWVGRLQGHRAMQRVAGPDLMREVFLRNEFAHYTHFFYGGREGVAEESPPVSEGSHRGPGLSAPIRRRFVL